ncbi:hypothetical protein CSA37_01590 [Candidatus Fermentibacteria bacterium]|nr:MAG: hypothetical protein CSA37_13540 [Candidatus Fermentibacteria bacterium]PIE53376.1 MAG: hypothetical protein CSA37_01590 [Candidatus Fermentibacteria bacterium]
MVQMEVIKLYLFCSLLFLSFNAYNTLPMKVPDISYFPDEPQIRYFSLVKETPGALWFVQDTTFFDLPSPEEDFQLIWGNLVTSETIDSISALFEGPEGMLNTAAGVLGPVSETVNGDDKIRIVFADIPDYYPVPGSGYRRLGNWLYTWPADFDGNSLTGNNHDIFYVNLSPYKNQTGGRWDTVRQAIYTWSVASGLGQITRIAACPSSERWIVRGLGACSQFICCGLTSELNGAIGIKGYMEDFARAGGTELTSWCSGYYGKDFSANIGGEFLWFQYIQQRAGTNALEAVAQSHESGMLAVAHAVDPAAPSETAIETVIYPLYEDWIVTNLISPFSMNYQEGDFHYKFLDGSGYQFSIVNRPASFLAEFDQYPIPTWIAPQGYGITAQEFAAQYADFSGEYSAGENTTVYFNGMYNQNNGSGANIDGQWTVYRIVLDGDSTLLSVDSLSFNSLFNGTFQLLGDRTFLAIMCNNPGGTANIRYALSQDTAPVSVFTSFMQNQIDPRRFKVFTSLYREEEQLPYGFDWTGPNVSLSLLDSFGSPDSTATLDMIHLEETIWQGDMEVWEEGNYNLVSGGYDSLGRVWRDTLSCAVAFADRDTVTLAAGEAVYIMDGNKCSPATVITLIESQVPPCQSENMSFEPVSVSPGGGLLKFNTDIPESTVLCYRDEEWTEIESYRTGTVVSAPIESAGMYALGTSVLNPATEVSPLPEITAVSPNPFSSGPVAVSYSTPSPAEVTVSVFDLTGRLVETICSEPIDGGVNVALWNAEAPAGVYFAVLKSGAYTDTAKLVRL